MTSAAFRPTHVVPQDGLPAWETPDPSRPTVPLDALLPVQLLDRLGDWGRVVCANGWSAWVDGRLLVGVPQAPPAATGAPARTADPRPLLARVEEALSAYRAAAEDLASGTLDGEAFRARTQGRRIGVVVDGESMWLYDGEHERWVYCDGERLSTFAAERTPTTTPPAPPERAEAEELRASQSPSADGPPPHRRPPDGDRRPPQAPEPTGPGSREAEPARAAEREPEPTQVVGRDGAGAGAGDSGPGDSERRREERERAAEETRAVPEAAPGGHEPTRVVTFDDDPEQP